MSEKQKTIIRAIAVEEAFLHPKLRALYKPSYVEQLDLLKDRLTDVGPERIKLMDASVDYPFGDNFEAVAFLRTAQLSPGDKEKLASGNAEQLLRLPAGPDLAKQSGKIFSTGLRATLFTFKARVKSKLGRIILSFMVK